MKNRKPCSASVRVASSKRTVWRRLVNQYSASSRVVSSQSAVTVEKNGTWAVRG